jgi:voltage-gated potassium channel
MNRNNRKKLYEIIFEAETPAGKAFDIVLIILILITVMAVIPESIPTAHSRFGTWLKLTEWITTILFTIEYIIRMHYSVKCVEKNYDND